MWICLQFKKVSPLVRAVVVDSATIGYITQSEGYPHTARYDAARNPAGSIVHYLTPAEDVCVRRACRYFATSPRPRA